MTRYPLKARVRVSWQDEHGSERVAFGKCVNISEYGTTLLLPDRIPDRAYIIFDIEKLRFRGTGSVRYTRRQGVNYLAGLEFSGDLKWDRVRSPLPK